MNNLSWFLYLADVIPSLATSLMIFGLLGIGIWSLRLALMGCDEFPFQGVMEGKIQPKYSILALCLGAVFIADLTPSKETIYLIAGSEAGEAVVTSETGQEILNDIQAVIKHQLGELKGEK